MWRPKTRLGWLGTCVLAALGIGGGLAVLVAGAIMVRVCTDAGSAAGQNFRGLPFFADLPPVLVIAHRGASKLAPEHSLVAYELALEQGAHVLELDLRQLADGQLIVAHDRTLARTLGRDVAFSELDSAELARIAGDRMPLGLDAVFGHFPRARLNLELKDEALDGPRALAASIAQHGAQGRVLVASSHRAVLEEFRRLTAGAIPTSASAPEALDYYLCYLMKRACLTPYAALQLPALGWLGVTGSAFIERAHERGLAVHFWTIDEEARMRALIAAGADGVMTNRPDVLARVLAKPSGAR